MSVDNGADIEPLTGLIPLWHMPHNQPHTRQLHGVFRALKCVAERVHEGRANDPEKNLMLTKRMLCHQGRPVPYALAE